MSMIRKQLQKMRMNIENQIQKIKDELELLPTGTFFCAQNGNGYKWYSYKEGKQIYIPKSDQNLAQQLTKRKLLELRLEELLQYRKQIEICLKGKDSNIEEKLQFLLSHEEYVRLLSSEFQPVSQELNGWMNDSYEKNLHYKENLIINTISGNKVRSKSEAMIDYCLSTHKIPFRYECKLELSGTIVYPDFTIRHPETGEYFYWENFGMMDDASYINKVCNKIRLYSINGIIPSINLITTYETKEHPLSIELVENIVNSYFG